MMTVIIAISIPTGIFLALTILLIVAEKYLADYGECIISLNEGSKVFQIPGGPTLLSALYEQKVFIPSACGGKGSCGYCKVTVIDGGGPILPTETGFMTRQEIRSGVRLACQVKIRQNIELKIPEELLNVKEFHARVSEVLALTYDIRGITFDLIEPAEIDFRPGQYIQILAQGAKEQVYRAYSISSPVSVKDKVQLMVRLVPGGIASTYIHNLNVGDSVTFTGPFGEFRLSQDPSVDIICVGGGAGMAPISNILFSVYEQWPDRNCYLFFGCRGTKDVFYIEEFKALATKYPNFKYVYALSDPLGEEEAWDGETGFIHLSVDKYLSSATTSQAFLCGPPPMIEAVMQILENKGMGAEDIFYDKF